MLREESARDYCDDGETLWEYDPYGNLTDDGTTDYAYDTANRPSSVTVGSETTTYLYNGDGDRISQTVDSVTTTYVLDTATPLTMVLAETTGEATIRYWHGLDTLGQSDGTTTEYFQYDGLGSVRQLVDTTGAVQLAQTFDAYGNGYAKSGTAASSFGYSGEQSDSNGFVFLRARYYNPSMGRFFQMDPSRLEKNPFQYALSNPILNTDPSGLVPERSDVTSGQAEYSCNCGWIDWTHVPMGVGIGREMLDLLETASETETCGSYWVLEAHYLQVNYHIPVADFYLAWYIPTDTYMLNDLSERRGMALDMFQTYAKKTESEQANNFPSRFAPTNFSEEDLFSDLLGFWAAKSNDYKKDIRRICNSFVSREGDAQGILASLYVYDVVYGGQPWILDVIGGDIKLPPLEETTRWKRDWMTWEPRLIDLPVLQEYNFGDCNSPMSSVCLRGWQHKVNECAQNKSRCMPSEILSLLDKKRSGPHFLAPRYKYDRLIESKSKVSLYESPW